ncbi:MAG: hypothetical protein MJE12_05195 [Alphaproteobacteria bacterium]|nr:hypothetical protein [Alphaproteobacteria bacterium]
MGYTIDQFAAECREILSADPGPSGREKVRQALEKVLVDADFVSTYLGPDNTSPRKILYEDPDLGFCVCAHVHTGAKDSPPHDHGPSWAIYGQADGSTTMTEWRVVAPRDGDKPTVVEPEKVYEMTPGMATLYDVGDIHSPSRAGPTRLIRIEGHNLDNIKRDPFVAA